MKNKYLVIDEFEIRDNKVLVLNEECHSTKGNGLFVDGETFKFALNSVRNWVVVNSKKSFKGKEIQFI